MWLSRKWQCHSRSLLGILIFLYNERTSYGQRAAMFIKIKAFKALARKLFYYFSGSQNALFCRCFNLCFVYDLLAVYATFTVEKGGGWEMLMNSWVACLGLWLKLPLRNLSYSKFPLIKLSFICLMDNCFVSLNYLIALLKIILRCFELP